MAQPYPANFCPQCKAALPSGATSCYNCNLQFPPPPKQNVAASGAFSFSWSLLVPATLILLLVIALLLTFGSSPDSNRQTSKLLAPVLGLIIFILVVILDRFIRHPSTPKTASPLTMTKALTLVALGLGLGIIIMLMLAVLAETPALALIITILSGGSLIALYYYANLRHARVVMLICSTALLAGVIFFAILAPQVVNILLGR